MLERTGKTNLIQKQKVDLDKERFQLDANYLQKNGSKFVFPKFLYARTTNSKTIDVSYIPQCLDAVEYIRNDSPDVELEEEIRKYLCEECSSDDEPTITEIARHFYELGKLNAKEE